MPSPWNVLATRTWFIALFVSCLGLSVPLAGHAVIVIGAELTDLADAFPGDDLWNARYTVSGGSFLLDQGFTIFFDPLLYDDLSAPLAPIPTGWDVLTAQPDILLSAPGFIDALAVVNVPSLAQPFELDFTWLGATLPGSQPFEIYDQAQAFHIIEQGQTILHVDAMPVVPEAGTACWAIGLFIFLAMSKWQNLVRGSARC